MAHEALTEATLRNLVNLERIANGLSAEQRARVRSLFDEIVGLLAKHDPTSVSARYRQARIEKIMGEVETLTGQTFREFRKTLRADLARLAVQQTDHAVTMLKNATELVVDIRRSAMSLDFARTIIDRDPFEGLTLADWAEGQEVRTVQQVRRQIQLGMLNNESIPDITKRVKGVGDTAEDNAEAVVRTAVNWISNDAHLRVYRANDDVLTAVQWTSTLDSRTCFVAGTRVLTPNGERPIEDLRAGDVVVGGSRTPRVVRGTTNRVAPRLVRVTLSNGEVVVCTPDHRFLTAGNEWVEAQALNPGQQLAEQAEC